MNDRLYLKDDCSFKIWMWSHCRFAFKLHYFDWTPGGNSSSCKTVKLYSSLWESLLTWHFKTIFLAFYGFIFDTDSEDWHESGGKKEGENMWQSAAVPRLAILSRIRNMVACSFQWAKPAPSNKSLLHALGMATEHVLVTPIPVSKNPWWQNKVEVIVMGFTISEREPSNHAY